MRFGLSGAAVSLAATLLWPHASPAAPPVITENISGVIAGSHTVDGKGYFGAAGADLSGAKVEIYVQYVPKLLGPSQECRTHGCTYNTSVQMPDTQGSLLITVTVNAHRVVYAPTTEAAIFFATQPPNQLTLDSDAFSGFGIGLPGLQLAAQFTGAPVFGRPLSPGNQPVNSASDYVDFYVAGSQTPVEELTYAPTGGTK